MAAGLQAVLDEPDLARQSALLQQCLRAQQIPAMREQALRHGPADALLTLARGLARLPDDPAALRWAARLAYDSADFPLAAELAERLRSQPSPLGDSDAALVKAALAHGQVAQVIQDTHRLRVQAPASAEARCAAVFLSYSRPEATNGYATRSHGLLSALTAGPWRIRAYTRPGFPYEGADHAVVGVPPAAQQVGPVLYRRLLASCQKPLGRMGYLLAAASEIEAALRRDPPALVHAASNYTTALPAWIAARRLGLAFVYEVRGFWDVTRSSGNPAFAHSVECRHLRWFERQLLGEADAVVTLTPAMAAELAARGAPASRILVAPNGVEATQVAHPLPCDEALAMRLGLDRSLPVIGYLGSFVAYEGLDDLLDAAAALHRRGLAFQLLLVGDGVAHDGLKERAQALGLGRACCFTGRVPSAEVANYYSLMDLCVYPRKAWPVAELVSPLKPFEAMAHARAVLMSDVAAMSWMIEPGTTGWLFTKGQVDALAAALADLLGQPERLRAVGGAARQEVLARRSWRHSADVVQHAYELALAQSRRRAGFPANPASPFLETPT